MQIVLLFLMTLTLSLSAPITKLELRKPITATDDKLPQTGKVITIVEKNVKPNKEETTLVVSEEMVFSSTGYPTFDAFDHNSDGFIEFEEFAASDGKDHKSNFQRADTNGDHKLTPEEFSRLPMVYEPEQFSDTDDEPPVVFLTPPESISRYDEKETSVKSDTGYDEGRDIPEFVSAAKEETKDDEEEVKEEHKEETQKIDDKTQKTTTETEKTQTSNTQTSSKTLSKPVEGSQFTADDMPVKIDDEDDEEMIEMKDEDIPMEVIDDLSEENHYDIDDMREPHEDEKQMNDQLNSIE